SESGSMGTGQLPPGRNDHRLPWRTHGNRRPCAALLLLVLLGATLSARVLGFGDQRTAPAAGWQGFQKTVRPFLARHCFQCHTEKPRGGVRLDRLDEKALAQRSPTLEKVLDVLSKRTMPPRKRPRPRADELVPVLAWLEAHVERREREAARSGRVLLR